MAKGKGKRSKNNNEVNASSFIDATAVNAATAAAANQRQNNNNSQQKLVKSVSSSQHSSKSRKKKDASSQNTNGSERSGKSNKSEKSEKSEESKDPTDSKSKKSIDPSKMTQQSNHLGRNLEPDGIDSQQVQPSIRPPRAKKSSVQSQIKPKARQDDVSEVSGSHKIDELDNAMKKIKRLERELREACQANRGGSSRDHNFSHLYDRTKWNLDDPICSEFTFLLSS